jgi:ABC-type bacteriocin/lantibiotic exporter with double-glycine peptidase domain
MKGSRLHSLRYERKGMNCGPKCFRWVLQQEGKSLTLEEARSLCLTTTMGTREPDLSAAFRTSGYQIELRQPIPWNDLNDLCKQYFVVVMYQCHYSVIVSANSESVLLFDPDWDRIIERTRVDFEPIWNDYEIDLDWTRRDYEHAAILVHGKQPVSLVVPFKTNSRDTSLSSLAHTE